MQNLHPLAVDRANKEPLPGALVNAFPAKDIVVGNLTVRPVVAYDYVIIKEINSPLYEQIFEPEVATTFTTEQACELCHLFTVSHKEARKQLRSSRDDFATLSTERFFENRDHLKLVQPVIEAIMEQFKVSMSTQQSYTSSEEGKEGEVNFTPATKDSPKTDSGGCSTTSVGSPSIPEKA